MLEAVEVAVQPRNDGVKPYAELDRLGLHVCLGGGTNFNCNGVSSWLLRPVGTAKDNDFFTKSSKSTLKRHSGSMDSLHFACSPEDL